ncbi:hypothetical protein [Pseudogracilibacillus sp. SO30301A]|uniref:hypothetical protein n=1 Tax=Pseudogracilibacillus sp. SO30301A TaxID=3098291 RepID=UPI00300E2634
MKKLYMTLFILLSTMVLLSACLQKEKLVDDAEDENNQEKNNAIALSDDLSEFENVVHDVTFDYGINRLVLSDLVANVELESIELNENSFVKNIMKWSQGYAVEVLLSDEPVQHKQTSELDVVMYPEKINGNRIQLYNENLKLQNEIDLTGVLPDEIIEGGAATAVSSDGSKLAWAYITDLYVYDINDGKLTTILNETTNQVNFEKIAFTQDDNKLVFFGSQIDHDEDEQSYGMIELDTKKISLHTENQFWGSDIQISPQYASITDVIDPVSNTSSGNVLIVDIQTGECFTMKVDGTESTMARITEDGKHLLVVKDSEKGNYRIRQYQLQTGEAVKETNLPPMEKESKVLAINATTDPSVYQIVVFTENKYYLFSFNSEES